MVYQQKVLITQSTIQREILKALLQISLGLEDEGVGGAVVI